MILTVILRTVSDIRRPTKLKRAYATRACILHRALDLLHLQLTAWFAPGVFATLPVLRRSRITGNDHRGQDFAFPTARLPRVDAIRTNSNLQEALRVAPGNGSEQDKLEARIEADVYEALQHAISK
ncbi:hypothetical protein FB451DRAFT_1399090 [Mycena latifolia]|nr:hypothetical protein FB451DRAFT_1399090 [Mycena latifolia]